MNHTLSSPENASAVGVPAVGTARPDVAAGEPRRPAAARVQLPGALSFRNIGAVYVWLAIAIIFAVWAPATFPTWTTARQILDSNAATGLMALSVVVPSAPGHSTYLSASSPH